VKAVAEETNGERTRKNRVVGLERCGRRDGLGTRAAAAAADPRWLAPATSSPVSQGMSNSDRSVIQNC
jgi:hypothetical protein